VITASTSELVDLSILNARTGDTIEPCGEHQNPKP